MSSFEAPAPVAPEPPVSEPPVSEPTVQLELEALPTMADLDQLQVELDDIDRVLADLDSERPDRRDQSARR